MNQYSEISPMLSATFGASCVMHDYQVKIFVFATDSHLKDSKFIGSSFKLICKKKNQ